MRELLDEAFGYVDLDWHEYVKIDGAWRIKVSTYERIFERVERLSQRPNFTAHYLAKADKGGVEKPA